MKIVFIDIVTIVLISILITLAILIIISDNRAKSFCISNGFEKGYVEEGFLSFNPKTVMCYNKCFDEIDGTHSCNQKYFRYVRY